MSRREAFGRGFRAVLAKQFRRHVVSDLVQPAVERALFVRGAQVVADPVADRLRNFLQNAFRQRGEFRLERFRCARLGHQLVLHRA